MNTRIYFPAPGPETMRTGNTGGGGEYQVGCRLLSLAHTAASLLAATAFVATVLLYADFVAWVMG